MSPSSSYNSHLRLLFLFLFLSNTTTSNSPTTTPAIYRTILILNLQLEIANFNKQINTPPANLWTATLQIQNSQQGKLNEQLLRDV
jgi:hypothetical protein